MKYAISDNEGVNYGYWWYRRKLLVQLFCPQGCCLGIQICLRSHMKWLYWKRMIVSKSDVNYFVLEWLENLSNIYSAVMRERESWYKSNIVEKVRGTELWPKIKKHWIMSSCRGHDCLSCGRYLSLLTLDLKLRACSLCDRKIDGSCYLRLIQFLCRGQKRGGHSWMSSTQETSQPGMTSVIHL